MSDDNDWTAEETAIFSDLAARAGVVAKRLLAERGLTYLEDLDPDASREVLRTAWREAAAQLFAGADLAELQGEIDGMIDSLILDLHLRGLGQSALH